MNPISFRANFSWPTEVAADDTKKSTSTRVSYDPSKDGAIADFDRTEKCKTLRTQYCVGVEKLEAFLKKHGSQKRSQDTAIKNLRYFKASVAQGVDGPYSTALTSLYSSGKEAFDRIVDKIDNHDALKSFKNEILEMTLGLEVCPPGVASHLMMTDQRINAGMAGIGGCAQRIWEDLFQAALSEFVEREHGAEPNFSGDALHHENRNRNALAQHFHVAKRSDEIVLRPRTPDEVDRCKLYLEERVTPERLLSRMAEQCLQAVHEHLGEYLGQDLDEATAFEIHQKFDQTLNAELTIKFGPIDFSTIVSEEYPGSTDENGGTLYRLIDNPTLLMRSISKNLFAAGIFDNSYKPLRIAGKKGGDASIKRIGSDGFYARTGRGPGRAYRPLRADELKQWDDSALEEARSDPSLSASMVRAALANTSPETSLNQMTPKDVWTALSQDADAMALLARLSSWEVLRYRKADPTHNEHLLKEALSIIRGLEPADCQSALLFASAQSDEGLCKLLVETLEDVSVLDAVGRSALHYAVRNQNPDLELIDSLVRKSTAIINIIDDTGHTPLMLAARHCLIEVIDMLLKAGADRDGGDWNGLNALMAAAMAGHADVIESLLQAGSSVHQKSANDLTALMIAAQYGHVDALLLLLKARADVHAKDDQGFTALMHAAHRGHPEVIELLLDAGADADEQSKAKFTALMLAAQAGHGHLIDLLVTSENVEKTDARGNTALTLAAQNGHAEAVDQLIRAGAQIDRPNKLRFTALRLAAQNGHAKVIDKLVPYADIHQVDKDGFDALMTAASNGHRDAVDRLLAEHADVHKKNNDGDTALHIAAQKGYADVVVRLLTAHADVDEKNYENETALMAAAQHGHEDVVDKLLDAGAKVDETTPKGLTALTLAARRGHVGVVSRLLTAGVAVDFNVDQEDEMGFTALMRAASGGHVDVIDRLLEFNAQANETSMEGVTALMMAAYKGHRDVIKRLLDAGARVNDEEHQGVTALMLAAESGHVDSVIELLDAGADVNAKNGDGLTALQLATRERRTDVINVLNRHHSNQSGRVPSKRSLDES